MRSPQYTFQTPSWRFGLSRADWRWGYWLNCSSCSSIMLKWTCKFLLVAISKSGHKTSGTKFALHSVSVAMFCRILVRMNLHQWTFISGYFKKQHMKPFFSPSPLGSFRTKVLASSLMVTRVTQLVDTLNSPHKQNGNFTKRVAMCTDKHDCSFLLDTMSHPRASQPSRTISLLTKMSHSTLVTYDHVDSVHTHSVTLNKNRFAICSCFTTPPCLRSRGNTFCSVNV